MNNYKVSPGITTGLSTLFMLAFSGAALASPIAFTQDPNEACNPDTVKITSVTPTAGGQQLVSNGPISATQCFGFVGGGQPNNGPLDNNNATDPNLGYIGDGLLNGAQTSGSNKYFLDPVATNNLFGADFYDLDGDGLVNDPGWIRLGGEEDYTQNFSFGPDNYDSVTSPVTNNTISISEYVTITFGQDNSGQGNWELKVEEDAPQQVAADLGRLAAFDHLAFVLKGGKVGWAVYNFNFNQLLAQCSDSDTTNACVNLGLLAEPFQTGLTISGTFDVDLNGTGQGNGGGELSHFSIWAHDPPAEPTKIPAPTTLALAGLGLLGLAYRRRSRVLKK